MWILALAVGCGKTDDTTTDTGTFVTRAPPLTPPPEGFLEGEFCQVRSVFELACTTGCHSDVVPLGDLDLLTDAWAATVNVPSNGGGVLVVPGDPASSVLLTRMKGAGALGGVMPPQGVVDPILLYVVETWILNGAVNDCVVGTPPPPPTTTTTGGRHHPLDWAESGQHGPAAQLQTDGDCRSCHGALLDGGVSGVTCDQCHAPGWRTDCTFCHGGSLNTTGAPPEDIDDNADPNTISFPEHTVHVAPDVGGLHAPYGCTQCHSKPTDVLTPGHVFDDVTAGYGELDYTGGIAPLSTYYQGTCSNTYCHGNGQVPGEVSSGQAVGCGDCHPGPNDAAEWDTMSGRHETHLSEGILCSECHQAVVDAAGQIVSPDLHVQGAKDVLAPEAPYVGGTCTGNCHDENHDARGW